MESSTRRRQEDDVGARLYNLFLLLVECLVLVAKFIMTIFEEVYYKIVPPTLSNVRDEIVLITGSAHGIGKQLAIQYGQLGAIVVCWDINEKGNEETVDEIKARGGKAYSYVCDVTSREAVNETAKRVQNEVGPVSIVINDAGIICCNPILEETEKEIRLLFDTNVLAHFWTIQAFMPDMIERNHGQFVALSSCAGLFGLRNLVPYCSTKFAVRGYMQALAEEIRSDPRKLNIKFTTIYPYMVDTGLCKNPRFKFENLCQLIKPEDAAAAIIDAQRRGIEEVSVPKIYTYLDKIGRLVPRKGMRMVEDFLNIGTDPVK